MVERRKFQKTEFYQESLFEPIIRFISLDDVNEVSSLKVTFIVEYTRPKVIDNVLCKLSITL